MNNGYGVILNDETIKIQKTEFMKNIDLYKHNVK